MAKSLFCTTYRGKNICVYLKNIFMRIQWQFETVAQTYGRQGKLGKGKEDSLIKSWEQWEWGLTKGRKLLQDC